MKILITGVNGQLGYDLRRVLQARGHQVIGADLNVPEGGADHPLDITDEDAVMKLLQLTGPEGVIHCAAWTDVDGAEDPANRDMVRAINAHGTANVARAAKAADAAMMYISTDYVFDGRGTDPWQPDDRNFSPLNWYGETKLLGEQAVAETLDRFFIVRISWVFGKNGRNFVRAIMDAGRNHDKLRVVDDQIGTPTYTAHLAGLLGDMIETDRYGYYHATNEGGYISWYDFAREIVRQAGIHTAVEPVSTEEYGLRAAARPENSRLDKSKLREAGFSPLPDWREALADYLREAEE